MLNIINKSIITIIVLKWVLATTEIQAQRREIQNEKQKWCTYAEAPDINVENPVWEEPHEPTNS